MRSRRTMKRWQGALYALPPWAETCRVVNAYGAMLNLDVRPLLRRIYAQLEAGIVELRPKAMPDVPVMTPPAPLLQATTAMKRLPSAQAANHLIYSLVGHRAPGSLAKLENATPHTAGALEM